ncbi:Atg31p [Saccharomyces paradoxus]|uniref:Atg31p n=1 Tax=Saccharomyces paradoxus TaxID=27291 RepID=A0A8B8UNP5_SACPA|nr:Atg31 [Saccharomyces paradoxus]QHS72244.1 Atg31 [Saccharomyces paradoxus]
MNVTVTVYDKNVKHRLEENVKNSKGPINNNQSAYNNESKSTDGSDYAMFPTNVRYIFEDNNDEIVDSSDAALTAGIDKDEDELENVIIVQLDESGSLEDITLISDQYELLSHRTNNLSLEENQMRTFASHSNDFKSNDDGEELSVDSGKLGMDLDIELDVISQFCDLSPLLRDLSLNDLIKLYVTQNEQLQMISNSI